ncbi:MAG: hypothetical protein MUO60_18525 [Clostridiaceae bacterium]|nr:hypothetical protein [Clostridiaceae bacterium]
MRKPIEYTEIETPSISIDKKTNMMKEIFEILEELEATSKDTAKTSKEINSKFKKEPAIKEIGKVNKIKKTGLNTPSFIGSLAGIMTKFGILGKVYRAEKTEAKWYIKGNIKMINDIKTKDM